MAVETESESVFASLGTLDTCLAATTACPVRICCVSVNRGEAVVRRSGRVEIAELLYAAAQGIVHKMVAQGVLPIAVIVVAHMSRSIKIAQALEQQTFGLLAEELVSERRHRPCHLPYLTRRLVHIEIGRQVGLIRERTVALRTGGKDKYTNRYEG